MMKNKITRDKRGTKNCPSGDKITVPGDKDKKEVLKESSKQKHKGH
jgi:hypothetical protein